MGIKCTDKEAMSSLKVAGKSLPKEGLDKEDAGAAVKELQSTPLQVWLLAGISYFTKWCTTNSFIF